MEQLVNAPPPGFFGALLRLVGSHGRAVIAPSAASFWSPV